MLHADSITKGNGKGKRKRSLGCARDDETREGYFPFLFIPLRKPTSAPSGHLLPEEGGRSGESHLLLPEEGGKSGKNLSTPFLWKGDARRAGGWPKVKESESQPPALRATSFQRKEGECRFPRIVISSASEKSFSFAVEQEKGGERKTGNPVLQASGDPHVRNG